MIENEILEHARELTKRLISLYSQRADLEVLKKEREDLVKNEIAEACNIRDKDGIALANKVKLPLVMAAIDELYIERPNKKADEYEIMDTYKSAIKNGEVGESVNNLVYTLEEIDGISMDVKEVYKEFPQLSKELINAITMFVKEQYAGIKQKKLIDAGLIEEKEPKDNSEVLMLKEELESKLKDLA